MPESQKKKMQMINPYTEEVLDTFFYRSLDDAKTSVKKAHEAYTHWSGLRLSERLEVIGQLSKKLNDEKENLVEIITNEMGKIRSEALKEIDACIRVCDYTVKRAEKALETQVSMSDDGVEERVEFKPQGVLLSIQPWNFPFYQALRASIPNLALGNTIALKHAQNVWGAAEKIRELVDSIPNGSGIFTPLYIEDDLVEPLLEMPEVCGLTLTGSSQAGRSVAQIAGKNLKKTVLELGGNDAYIIMNDVNLEEAVSLAVAGRTKGAGQVCVGAKRFIVLSDVYEDFVSLFKERMSALRIGDPKSEETDLGPLARKDLLEKLEEQVQSSISEGAVCTLGGKRPPDQKTGYFYEPTILTHVKPGMKAYREELFGPVAVVFKAENEDQALQIANDSAFGLGGGVFTKDEKKGLEIASKIESGMAFVNGICSSKLNLPFGGVKNSGYGREHGDIGFKEFANIKTIQVRKSQS
jgi:succinate-semialdehyde dehydrogenase/glutarate-semialdehyde dehydrogenase